MTYELYYWPEIQGRGEFIRLALEETGAPYIDVARRPGKQSGVPALMRFLDWPQAARVTAKGTSPRGGEHSIDTPPFAPPFLKAGKQIIGQTANILLFIGARHGLAPRREGGRLWTNQLQLTIADFLGEVHDTHHPVASGLYYEDQRKEAARRAADFLKKRAPKFLGYFEEVLARNPSGDKHLVGRRLTYADLSLFQLVAGLRYAFPRAMARLQKRHPRVISLHDRVAKRPRIAAYLASERRIAFNEQGIFRHYKELDQ
jgi:glutathione S-transferase